MHLRAGISGAALVGAMCWVAACSKGSTSATTSPGAEGGTADSFTVTFGPIPVAAGYEHTQCIVVSLKNPTPIHVGQIHNVLGDASHHMIVYRVSDTTERLTPFDCQPFTDTLDPTKGSALMVTQKKDDLLSLPAGVGYTLDANQMLRVEMHYINPTGGPLTLTSTSTMIPIADADYHDEAGFLFIGDPDIALPPNASTKVGPVFFQLPAAYASAKFFAITGHEHQLGTNVQISTAASKSDPGTAVYDVPNWSWSEPATVVPSAPFSIPAGGGFQFTCSWNNTSQKMVRFGESANDEMCFFWAYYYPSTGSTVCLHTDAAKGGADFCCPGSPNCAAFFGVPGNDGGVQTCNTVTNAAPAVPITNVAAAAPAPTGGAIPDGTYFVTAALIYTGVGGKAGPTGITYQGTDVSTGGNHFALVYNQSDNPGDLHNSGTFTVTGPNVDIETSCPTPSTSPFTALTTDGVGVFTIYTSQPPVQAFTFTKQP
jgi:Copper type II ascorbate-dependent monooxygenase, C-terminal domain